MILEKWSDTGVRIEREPTAAELSQMEADAAAFALEQAEREAAAAAKEAAKASAIAKLAALGLDESEVAALIGGSL